jgi:hypothetical protein
MRERARRAARLGAAAFVVAAALAAAAQAGQPSGQSHKDWQTSVPVRAVLNGVMDVKKDKLGRFNFTIHVTRGGVVSGHGDYNGGGANYVQVTQITSFSCTGDHLAVTAAAFLNHTQAVVPVTIAAVDGGPGVGYSGDTFSISFGKYSRSGSPVAGKVFIKGCP